MVLLRELTLTATVLAISMAGGASAFYSKSGPVVMLDAKNFNKEVLQSNHASIVEFFAPWCGHCQSLKPAYEKVAKSLKGLAKVVAINCDEETNKRFCSEQGVEGFPTLKTYKPTAKKGKPIIEDFKGPRTAKAISDAVVDKIPNHVTRLTSDKLDSFLSTKNESAKALLFTTKGTTSPLYKALAVDFLGSITFAQVREKEAAIAEAFGVTEFPKLVVLPGGLGEGKVYEGKMEKETLFGFLKQISPPVSEPSESSSGTKRSKKTEDTIKKEKKVVKEKEKEKKEGDAVQDIPTPEKEPESPKSKPEKPTPEIPELPTPASLKSACLHPKSKTCILIILNIPDPKTESTTSEESDPFLHALSSVHHKITSSTTPHAFKFFKISAFSPHAEELVQKLDLAPELPIVFAINSQRRWVRKYTGDVGDTEGLLAWIDAIRLGELKKERLPDGLVVEEPEEEEEGEGKESEKGKHDEL